MESYEIEKSTLYLLGIAAVVIIWTLAAGVASTVMVSSASASSSDTGSVAIEAPRNNAAPAMFTAGDTTGFLEWHINPPTASGMGVKRPQLNVTPAGALDLKVLPYEEMRFLEMNLFPQGRIAPKVLSHDEMRFLEMNLLPVGSIAPKVRSSEEIRFLEMNVLPGDGSSQAPARDEHYPASEGLYP